MNGTKYAAYSLEDCERYGVVSIRDDWKGGPPTARVFVHEDHGSIVYSACGRIDCHVSTGIHGGITCGSGDLDQFGFWENPCDVCARDRERQCPEDGKVWPFSSQELENGVTTDG